MKTASSELIDDEIAKDIRSISRIDAVPSLLRVLCQTTGMGFAAVARVTEDSWTACAVQDDIQFGLKPGGQLDVDTTLCREAMISRNPIAIDQASIDPVYRDHHTPRIYGIESYVSVPIVMSDGSYFGNLCAIDPKPALVRDPRILSMFNLFAELIAVQLENERRRDAVHAALLDERATNELREQFIAILGHDLRNPLAAVSACAHVLQMRSTDPALVAMASHINGSVRRMSGLIDDVLDFARGRLGSGLGVQLADVTDLESALTGVVDELLDANPDRSIVSLIEIEHTVRCDRGRIQQLASNLLGNALTHGSPQGIVKFSAITTEQDLLIQVWNDGDPIPPGSVDKVFGPFWRHTTSAKREGLGLGLHICSEIAKAHEGTIAVASTRELGTTFTVRLPRLPA